MRTLTCGFEEIWRTRYSCLQSTSPISTRYEQWECGLENSWHDTTSELKVWYWYCFQYMSHICAFKSDKSGKPTMQNANFGNYFLWCKQTSTAPVPKGDLVLREYSTKKLRKGDNYAMKQILSGQMPSCGTIRRNHIPTFNWPGSNPAQVFWLFLVSESS